MNPMKSIQRFFVALVCVFCLYYAWLIVVYDFRPIPVRSFDDYRFNIRFQNQTSRGISVSRGTKKAKRQQPSSNCYDPVFLVIVVSSAPNNFERRSAIRNTWARAILDVEHNGTRGDYTELVTTVFLLGQAKDELLRKLVATEAKYYGDVVTGSFLDSYRNLTLKTKLGFEWVNRRCKFEYFLKTDDDIFVNINGLVKWLRSLPRENLYTGRCAFNKSVIRIPNHKWAVPKTMYERDYFPPYCVGMGYILSSDVLKKIIKAIPSQAFVVLEDVFVGLLIEKFNIKPVDNSRYFQLSSDYSGDMCGKKDLLLTLDVNPIQMLTLHLKFLNQSACG